MFGFEQFKKISIKRLSLQGVIGGFVAYGTAKAAGANEQQSIAAGIASLLTSVMALAQKPSA